MKVTIKFYGRFSEKFGKKHEIELPERSNINDMLNYLKNRFPDLKNERSVLISVNDKIVDNNEYLKDGENISIFPPPGGG